MKRIPLISVIVPAFNAAQWIEDCCRSVISQTYTNWELIIVDDGSTDETLEIIKKLAKIYENINYLHTENNGVTKARNIGLDIAKGEYITFLDADDMLVVNALEKMYKECHEHEYDIVVGWKTNIDVEGNELGCPYEMESCYWKGRESLEMSLRDYPATYAVWGKLYKKAFIENIRFIEGKRVHEDSFFNFQCFCNMPKVKIIKEVVLFYRITPNSASRSVFSEKYFDILYFADEKLKTIICDFPELYDLAMNMYVKANMALLNNLKKGENKLIKQYEKKCIKNIIDNKKYFIPAIELDKRMYWIVTNHMYYPYKCLLKLKCLFFRK